MHRISVDYDPVSVQLPLPPPYSDYPGRASWLNFSGVSPVYLVRLKFTLKESAVVRFHVSADIRYMLYFDGKLLERGPERGDICRRGLDGFEIKMEAGEHCFLARILTLPNRQKPWGLIHTEYGFLLAAEEPFGELSTGRGAWEVRPSTGIVFPHETDIYRIATGIPGVYDAAEIKAEGSSLSGWQKAESGGPAYSALASLHFPANRRLLYPAGLPPQLNKPVPFSFDPVEVAPGESFETIIDLGDYYCFYPEPTLSGDGVIEIGATEALYQVGGPEMRKVPRNSLAGELRNWHMDSFVAAEEPQTIQPFFYRCGRLLVIRMKAGKHPLKLEGLRLMETRYPWEITGEISGGERFDRLAPALRRTLEMCTHDTYVDCPFYEQLMYAGDTRVEALISNVISPDRRMQRKAAAMFDRSRNWTGMPASCCPENGRQVIPAFSLIWMAMVHDNLMWDPGAEPAVRGQLAGIRSVMDAWELNRRPDGLIATLNGWNHVTAIPGWEHCIPPEAEIGEVAAVPNMMFLCFSKYAALLERHFGFTERAEWIETGRKRLAERLRERYYVPEYRLFADDAAKTLFSEPIQCLAILSGMFEPDAADGMFASDFPIEKCNFYFSHYYFEACRERGRADAMLKRLEDWELISELDLSTTPETTSGESRSDCHAWSAAPLFHWYASLAGIRPAAPGFVRVAANPAMPGLQPVRGKMPHPAGGFIRFDFNADYCELSLPEGVAGELVVHGRKEEIPPGETRRVDSSC